MIIFKGRGPMCSFFYQCLTFHDHISSICKSTHFQELGKVLTFDVMEQFINVLITTCLDFSILYNLVNNKIERLQRIHNQAARMLKRIPLCHHITPFFERVALIKNS